MAFMEEISSARASLAVSEVEGEEDILESPSLNLAE